MLQDEQLLELEWELQRDGSLLALYKLQIALDVGQILRVLLSQQLHALALDIVWHRGSLSLLLGLACLVKINNKLLLARSCGLVGASLGHELIFAIILCDEALLVTIRVHDNISAAFIVLVIFVTLIRKSNFVSQILRLLLLLASGYLGHLGCLRDHILQLVEIRIRSCTCRDATHLLFSCFSKIFEGQVHQLGHKSISKGLAQVREMNAKTLLHLLAILEL